MLILLQQFPSPIHNCLFLSAATAVGILLPTTQTDRQTHNKVISSLGIKIDKRKTVLPYFYASIELAQGAQMRSTDVQFGPKFEV